jgi:hypothetical protein
MKPFSPVLKGFEDIERLLAKDQMEYYQPLPVIWCHDDSGNVVSRWKLTWKERFRIFFHGDLYLQQLTFWPIPSSGKFQPQLPSVKPPILQRIEVKKQDPSHPDEFIKMDHAIDDWSE